MKFEKIKTNLKINYQKIKDRGQSIGYKCRSRRLGCARCLASTRTNSPSISTQVVKTVLFGCFSVVLLIFEKQSCYWISRILKFWCCRSSNFRFCIWCFPKFLFLSCSIKVVALMEEMKQITDAVQRTRADSISKKK